MEIAMQRLKKLDHEDRYIFKEGLLRSITPDTETGIPQSNHYTSDDAGMLCFLEAYLDTLTTEVSSQVIIKKFFLANNVNKRGYPKVSSGYLKFVNSWQGGFVRHLANYIYLVSELPRECIFSIQMEIFRTLCRDRNFRFDEMIFRDFCKDPYLFYLRYGEANGEQVRVFINDFFKDLCLRLREPKIRREILRVRKAAESNTKEYCRYVRNHFAARTPINVIKIDLSYQKGTRVSIKDLIKDLEHFHRNMRHKPKLFKGLFGYIEKIEYGLSKGLHIHVLLFFTSERQSNADVYLAQSIGEYWVNEITGGKGSYWNGNANKKQFEALGRLGIGEIHAHDEKAINHLCHIVTYMCKVEQFIRPVANPKTKLLRRGGMPRLTYPKRGRPRNIKRNAKLSSGIEKTHAVPHGYIPHQWPSSILQRQRFYSSI